MTIKELRESKGLSQKQASVLTGLSLRTYQNYELGVSTRDKFKISQIVRILSEYEPITEERGILTIPQISEIVAKVCKEKNVEYVYLFGSYAKDKATEKSDVDLLISCEEKGLRFLGIADELSASLHKRLDLLRLDDVKDNLPFLNEVLKTGVKIYG